MNVPSIGDTVHFDEQGETLNGQVERVLKQSAPFRPSNVASDWTFHVTVAHTSIRLAGTYQLKLSDFKIV